MNARADGVRIIVKKKKVAAHGGHHGGAWKVAYADFVTAMMALFIVLWLLTQADLRTRSQIARYFRDPGVLSGGADISASLTSAKETPRVVSKDVMLMQDKEVQQLARESEQRVLERQAKQIEQKLAESPELSKLKDRIKARVTDEGLVIDLVDDEGAVLFDRSSAQLKPALIALLEEVGAV